MTKMVKIAAQMMIKTIQKPHQEPLSIPIWAGHTCIAYMITSCNSNELQKVCKEFMVDESACESCSTKNFLL